MSVWTNSTNVTIADTARLTFFEIINDERIDIITLAMTMEHLENIAKIILKTIDQHKAINKLKN